MHRSLRCGLAAACGCILKGRATYMLDHDESSILRLSQTAQQRNNSSCLHALLYQLLQTCRLLSRLDAGVY